MPAGIIFSIEDSEQKQIIKTFCSHAKNNRVPEMVKMLQEYPAFNIDTPFTNGFTALHYACKNKSLDAASFLLRIGADLNKAAKDNLGTTPLDYLCVEDIEFKKKVLEVANTCQIMKALHISRERTSRFQPGDLYYEVILQNAHNILDDEILSMLYSITGDKFDLAIRKNGDAHIYDILFDSRDSGLVSLALLRVGIPHEYVNSKYLVVPDIKATENIATIKAFYSNPQNKYYIYCDDELKENRIKDDERGSNIKSLGFPSFIEDKYFTLAPQPSPYFRVPKNDPEAQLYFARKSHKGDSVSGDSNIKCEQLAVTARESLAKTFPACVLKPFPKL